MLPSAPNSGQKDPGYTTTAVATPPGEYRTTTGSITVPFFQPSDTDHPPRTHTPSTRPSTQLPSLTGLKLGGVGKALACPIESHHEVGVPTSSHAKEESLVREAGDDIPPYIAVTLDAAPLGGSDIPCPNSITALSMQVVS